MGTVNRDLLNNMLKQLNNDKLETILLEGIPQSGLFIIDKLNSKKWINKQNSSSSCNVDHKKTAKFFIDTSTYISHSEFIDTFKESISKFFSKLDGKKYIISTEPKDKSGYFFTMIFLLIVKNNQDYYNPIEIFLELGGSNRTERTNNNQKYIESISTFINDKDEEIGLLQLNDADYSGTQTLYSIFPKFNKLINECPKIIVYMVRAFASKQSLDIFEKHIYGNNKYNKLIKGTNFEHIYSNLIPSWHKQLDDYKDLTNTEKDNIKECYKDTGPVNIYFDHKVASNQSTLASFYLDNQKLNDWETPDKENTFIPLIKMCDEKGVNTDVFFDSQEKGAEKYRCPAAWYKYLNYDDATIDFDKIPRLKHIKKINKTKRRSRSTSRSTSRSSSRSSSKSASRTKSSSKSRKLKIINKTKEEIKERKTFGGGNKKTKKNKKKKR